MRTAAQTILLILLISVAIAPAIRAEKWRSSLLIGHWYGEGYQPSLGQNAQWINDIRADGTFHITFRWSADCKAFQTQTEAGVWDLVGDVETTVTTSINGKNLPAENLYRDTYEIKSLTSSRRVYVQQQTGDRFSARRVPPEFRFPPCRKETIGADFDDFRPLRSAQFTVADVAQAKRIIDLVRDWATHQGLAVQEPSERDGRSERAYLLINTGEKSFIAVDNNRDPLKLSITAYSKIQKGGWHVRWSQLVGLLIETLGPDAVQCTDGVGLHCL